MGTWFNYLATGIKAECLHHFSSLILAVLCQKNTGLLGHSTLDFLVTGTDDGYFALYQIAQIGGHPLLSLYPIVLYAPIQNTDTDLASYLAIGINTSLLMHYLVISLVTTTSSSILWQVCILPFVKPWN